jgi:putative transposase
MSCNRILGEGKSYYHCISRTTDRAFVFEGAEEKELCSKIMRKLSAFLGIGVVTYVLMSNHFHLLVEVPDRAELPPLTEEELLDLLPTLYDHVFVDTVRQELERARQLPSAEAQNAAVAKILERFEKRRGDLAIFMKEFKHRVTRYINKKRQRIGTLWESRYKSVLIEGNEGALLTVAAYIDLNPVRAGIVERPEDYRWCGYAEAAAGKAVARKGLGTIMAEALICEDYRSDWRRTHSRYRLFLYGEGREIAPDPETGQPGKKGFSPEKIEEVEQASGAMPITEALLHKIRYFTDGVVLGSAEFVNRVFERERHRFGPKRKDGARKLRGANFGALRVLRDLRVRAFG